MNVEDSNQLLDNVSGTLFQHIKKQGGNVDYLILRFIIKQGIILLHCYQTIQQLLEEGIIYVCIKNLNEMDTHVHNDEFLHEMENDLDSIDSESIYVQYAIQVKKYKKICMEHENELRSVLHVMSLCTLEDMLDVIGIANTTIKKYKELKENVCASVFRMFEYIVEYEQLQTIMDQTSLPSSDPLLELEEAR